MLTAIKVVAIASSGMMLALPEPRHVLVWLSAGGFAMLGCVAVFCRSEAMRQALWTHEYRYVERSACSNLRCCFYWLPSSLSIQSRRAFAFAFIPVDEAPARSHREAGL